MKTRPTRPLLLCAFFFAALCSNASATVLDASFGGNGRVAVELGDKGSRANAVLVQPDGKIVAAGYSSGEKKRDFMLFRLLPDGSLDTAFNQNGTVTTAVSPSDDEALTLALQADGKIIAAGYSSSEQNRDFALVRYNSDGSLDSSFGAAGMVVTAVGSSNDEITGVAVQEDGKIVLTGAAQGANGRVAVLARYLSDGKPDPAFGEAGFTLSVVGVDAQAESVALGKDGRILLSGTYSDSQRRGLMLLGFDSKGKLDQTFGEKGIAVPADSSVFSEGYGMFVNEDGSILVAGSTGSDGERDAALFRFAANGQPDSGFEENGVLVSSAGQGDDVLYGVDVTESAIVAAGFKTVDEQREFLLVTYTQKVDGKLSANLLTTGFSSGKDTATALAAVDNSVVAAGESTDDAEPKAAVSKYTLEEAAQYLVSGTAVETKTTASSDPGSQYVLTLQPYEVTRTTAIVPVEVQSALGDVSKRGVVFSTMSNPMLKDSSSSSSSDAPVVTNNSPTSVTGTSATLMLTTDVDATCKYTTSKEGMDYSLMKELFDTTGGKNHSEPVSGLTEGTHTYYARCKNTANNKVNTTDTVISFKVTSSGATGTTGTTGGTGGKEISSETDEEFNSGDEVILHVTTREAAECNYDTANVSFETMTGEFIEDETDKKHEANLGSSLSIKKHTYHVKCKTESGAESSLTISFNVVVALLDSPVFERIASSEQLINNALRNVGRFFIGTAVAQTTGTSGTTGTTGTTTSSTSKTTTRSNITASATTANGDFIEEGYSTEGSGSGTFNSKLTKLKPGTLFYARAYAVVSGTVYYGNEVGFRTADSCFVATAAFGSVFHPAVQVLRDFRDQFLSNSPAGRALVDLYYRTSPPLADLVSQHDSLRMTVRLLLLPVTGAAWLALHLGTVALLLPLGAVILLLGWQTLRRRTQGRAAAIL